MAHPKRRHSNTRTNLRRAHDHLQPRSLSKCSNCGRALVSHRICKSCGYYRGRQVITLAAKSKESSETSS
ncbi:MAG: 50S ribosomal protein L32 [Candidatus Omnitrophica bacterium]|nr:50S ribosomal protein L32 [Candidatus Omnitrophota bacterium]